MKILRRDPPARVERYKTSEGKEFVIARKPRRGRKYQEPQLTGDKLSCPYCSQEHDVVYYSVVKGRKGEKKVRTWICPKVGKLPLNQGRQWDEYIGSIIVRDRSEAQPSSRAEVQTSERVFSREVKPKSTNQVPGEMHADIDQSDIAPSQDLVPKSKVTPFSLTKSLIAEFPKNVLKGPVRVRKARRNSADSRSDAIRRFIEMSPKSLDMYATSVIEAWRSSRSRSARQPTLSEKLHKFRTR